MRNKIALLAATAGIFYSTLAFAQSAPPAVYVTSPRTLTNNQTTPLFTDVNGNLKVTGSISATNPSVGTNATTAPTSSTQIGILSGSNLVPVSASNQLPITGTVASTQSGTWNVGGVGAAGTPSGGVFSVQGVSGGVAQPMSLGAASVTVGAYSDGAIASIGTTSDAAWSSGSGSLISLGKATVNAINAPIPVGTNNIGTVGVLPATAYSAGTSYGSLTLGSTTTSAPTYTTGQVNPLSLDTAGNLRVNVVTGGAGGGAVYGPTAVGSAAANPPVLTAGTANATATGAVQVEKVDSSGNQYVVLSTGANTIGAISNTTFASTESGTWTVQPGNTANTTPWIFKISDGTNAAAIKAASTAAVATDPALVVAISPNNTIAATQSGTWNINSITTLPALAAGSAVIGVTGYSQNSTTSGQSGELIQGAVTTATPSYTNAQTSALSLDTNGGLRVQPAGVTPAAATASVVTTGGTAVTSVTGPVRGCYITNPTSATDQNIATAENLYVNPVTTATTPGNGTTLTLVPGQSFFCIPGQTTNVSVVAATSSHAFTVVKW